MALTLLPTTAEAADFTGWTKLSSGNYDLGIGKYYLTSDVTMNELSGPRAMPMSPLT